MSLPLLQTKLYIPPPRPQLVPRPAVTAKLQQGAACLLTLVAAPAGFGKTTLVSEWITHSIVDRICGSLADTLTQSATGQATLEQLEQSNLFLIALDDQRYWYRYHQLVADVLRLPTPLA